ncbi:MAG: hypothetical protein DMG61_08360 [Acidobacteria bacterium]|nr:MAG: hypothetical protein DMG61_08360 [Acidobacteriota bacterium]
MRLRFLRLLSGEKRSTGQDQDESENRDSSGHAGLCYSNGGWLMQEIEHLDARTMKTIRVAGFRILRI